MIAESRHRPLVDVFSDHWRAANAALQ